MRVNVGVIGFWRTSLEDGIYTTTGGLRRTGQLSDAPKTGRMNFLALERVLHHMLKLAATEE